MTTADSTTCSSPPCAEVGPFRYCPIRGCGWMETPPTSTEQAYINEVQAEIANDETPCVVCAKRLCDHHPQDAILCGLTVIARGPHA